jgi:hypothetical protein
MYIPTSLTIYYSRSQKDTFRAHKPNADAISLLTFNNYFNAFN